MHDLLFDENKKHIDDRRNYINATLPEKVKIIRKSYNSAVNETKSNRRFDEDKFYNRDILDFIVNCWEFEDTLLRDDAVDILFNYIDELEAKLFSK